MSQTNLGNTVAVCMAAAAHLASEPNVGAVKAQAFAVETLQHYAAQAGISVQIEAVCLDTRPPTVYLAIPVDVDANEYCASAELHFGSAVVLEPFVC